jgi:UDP-glucuronate decarboxylase
LPQRTFIKESKGLSVIDQVGIDARTVQDRTDLSFFKHKRILVTGASGIIGANFLSVLASQSQGKPAEIHAITKSGKFPVELSDTVKPLVMDLTDPIEVSRLGKYDFILHAAGYGQPGKFLHAPLKTMELNVGLTASLIEKMDPNGTFVFMSTSEIYSGLTKPPFNEDQVGTTNTNHPRASYIEGKRSGEAIVAIAKRELGLDAKSLRLALAYGPGTKDGDERVLNTFIEQALQSKSIELRDSGDAWRTYCYVSDAVQMILDAALQGDSDIYNIGGKSRIQIKELARLIGRLTDATVEIPEGTNSPFVGAPDDVWLDLSKIGQISNLEHLVTLEDGIARTISWRKTSLQVKN